MKKIFEYVKKLSFYDTIRHGSFYTFSFIAIQVISVITLPIFTKLLSPSDFGVYEVFNNTVRIFGVIFSLNLYTGFYRFYFDNDINNKNLLQFLLRTSFLSFFIGAFLLYLFYNQLFTFINLPVTLFVWMLLSVFSNIFINYFNIYNNVQQFSKQAAIWQFVIQVSKVIVSIFIVFYFHKNYFGRILGENIVLFFFTIIIVFIYFRNYIGLNENLPKKKEIIKYSIGFIPIGLSGFILGYLDTIMINKFNGSNDAGLYSYAYKMAVIYSGVTSSFIIASKPKLFDLMNQHKEEEVIQQLRSMFKLVVALSSFFIFFSMDVGKFLAFNKAFYAGLHLMPILILSYIFNDLNDLYSFYLHYEKKVKYFYYSFFIAATINLILNFLLIPQYGYAAAAYTTLISYAFMLVTTYFICKVILKIKVPAVIRFMDYLLIILLILLSNYIVNYQIEQLLIQIIIKSIIYLFVLIYLWRNIISGINK